MQIVFNKAARQLVYSLLRPSVKNKTCPFCREHVRAKNFAGVFHYNGHPRFLHRNIVCLISYSDYLRHQEGIL